MLLHLATAADNETLFGHIEAIERAAGNVQLFEDCDAFTGHSTVADEEGRASQSRKTRADEPRSLLVRALRFSGRTNAS